MMSVTRLLLLFLWALALMFFTPFMILFTFNRQFPLYVARTLFSKGILKIAGAKLTVFGEENAPKDRPVIFVANHCSYLDIAVLCRVAPVNLYFIGKKELAWIPIVGWYMFFTDHIFIDRSNKRKAIESLKKAAEKIKNGKSVALYPEGTRSKTGELGVFKKGAFHLALDAGVSIVPIHIKGTYNIWSSLNNKITPGPITVRIGKPIESFNYTKATIRDFVSDTKSVIEELSKKD